MKGVPLPWERSGGPWRDSDDAQLVTYVATVYVEFSQQTIMDQKTITVARHAFHPVKEYLEGLEPWDGVPRVDTLLIDYLGAEDTVYTREATAKILTAAVRRIYEPGCKFDSMLVLSGPPNTGKSMLVARLGGSFFSDNLTFDDMKDKTAAEKLQGYWLLEVGEMKGMRKMDVDSIKAFISRQEDIYRAAYGHNTERHPRQCVIFGTVNDLFGYLKDVTGNRRSGRSKSPARPPGTRGTSRRRSGIRYGRRYSSATAPWARTGSSSRPRLRRSPRRNRWRPWKPTTVRASFRIIRIS